MRFEATAALALCTIPTILANTWPALAPQRVLSLVTPKYGGRRAGTRNWATVIRAAAPIRSLAAVLADERAFLAVTEILLASGRPIKAS